MATLLQALLKNESGGRNVTNVHQSTSSGRARGYFQITDGTWAEFGGRQYAPTAQEASYEQQAAIASKIPLRRWDESTVALMRATGRPIDPNRTLGENLAAHGESFADAGLGGNPPSSPTRPADQFWPDSGQAELAASQGTSPYALPKSDNSGSGDVPTPSPRPDQPKTWRDKLHDIGDAIGDIDFSAMASPYKGAALPAQPGAANFTATPPQRPQQAVGGDQRQQLAMIMQRLNQGVLF